MYLRTKCTMHFRCFGPQDVVRTPTDQMEWRRPIMGLHTARWKDGEGWNRKWQDGLSEKWMETVEQSECHTYMVTLTFMLHYIKCVGHLIFSRVERLLLDNEQFWSSGQTDRQTREDKLSTSANSCRARAWCTVSELVYKKGARERCDSACCVQLLSVVWKLNRCPGVPCIIYRRKLKQWLHYAASYLKVLSVSKVELRGEKKK